MKRILLIAVLLLGACAPEVPTMAETSGGEAAAGSGAVASNSEALSYTCNSASYCQFQKDFVNYHTGTTWTWSNSQCGTSVLQWNGSAPGGRVGISFLPANTIAHRQFELSQQANFIVHCDCVGNNFPSCHY
jgi:hypothetical protein